MDPPREFMSSTVGSESPTTNDLGQFSFVSTEHNDEISGTMINPADEEHFQQKNTSIFDTGLASSLLKARGVGWLLEVEDSNDETFDKPLLEELDIDLKDIYYKVRCVLFPLPQLGFERKVLRENPDFWGPLIVVLCYSLLSLYGQFKVVSWILTIWFCGSFIIFFLTRALGGEVSYSQCLGVIGYSLLPLIVIGSMLPLVQQLSFYIPEMCKIVGVAWASYSAGSLLVPAELNNKRTLLFYPVFLLYVYFFSLYTGA